MPMNARTAIQEGFRLARRSRSAVWVMFLANLGLAAVAALPIYRGILNFTGHSLMSQSLAHEFSRDWLTDFAFNSPGSLERYAAVVSLFGLLAIPVNSILAGGVLARFRTPERDYSLGDFFRNTSRHAWGLTRLMVVGLFCYWTVFLVLNRGFDGAVGRWTRDWLDDRPVFWFHLAAYLFLFLALAFVNLVMDYARARLVMDESSGAVEAFLASLGFALGRWRKALLVYAVPSLLGVALLGLYRLLTPWSLINTSLADARGVRWLEPLTLAALFLGQQLIMLGRYWLRVAAWASEWSFLRNN